MSSKGSPIVAIRFPEELKDRIETQIEMTEAWLSSPEIAFGQWVRKACEEKLAKMSRSRRARTRPKAQRAQLWTDREARS